MCKGELIPIKRRVPMKHLESMIRQEKDPHVMKRLFFIKHRYKGDHVSVAAKKVLVDNCTGYDWQERWNKQGYLGLKPQYSGGAHMKLSDDQVEDLKKVLNDMGPVSTDEPRLLILHRYGVEYTIKQVWVILNKFDIIVLLDESIRPALFSVRRCCETAGWVIPSIFARSVTQIFSTCSDASMYMIVIRLTSPRALKTSVIRLVLSQLCNSCMRPPAKRVSA